MTSAQAWLRTAVLALSVTVFLGVFGSENVHNDAELRVIDLGWPLHWLGSHTDIDPPYPYRVGMSDPWNHVQDLHPGLFVLDFLFWWVVLLAGVIAYAVLARSWRARRSSRGVKTSPPWHVPGQ